MDNGHIEYIAMKHTLQGYLWAWRRRVEDAGMPFVVGVGMGVFALTVFVSAIIPAQGRLQKLVILEKGAHTALLDRPSPAEELIMFQQALPKVTAIPDQLELIVSVAQKQHIALDQAEYRLVSLPNSRLIQYEVTLPLHGSYSQIKKFITASLYKVPTMSLDAISLQRQKVNEGIINARVNFTFYLLADR